MGLELGRKADYALRAMIALARSGPAAGPLMKARQIAVATGVPASYLPQVLAELVRAGLVTSVAGPNGGYATARPASEISLLEVVEGAAGPVRSWTCPLRGDRCGSSDPCAVHDAWSEAQEALRARLASSSLETIAQSGDLAALSAQEPT